MYNTMNMPPWGWGYPPMAPPQNNAPDLNTIREWARMLKDWEKELKGSEKKPENKGPPPSIISMMLLMLLLSPITGGLVFQLFQLSLGAIHK